MEAQAVQALQFSSTLHSNLSKPEKTWPNGSLRMFGGFKKQPFVSSKLQSAKPSTNIRRRTASLVVACSHNNIPGCCKNHAYFDNLQTMIVFFFYFLEFSYLRTYIYLMHMLFVYVFIKV